MKTKRFADDVIALSVGRDVEWKPNGGVWLSLHTEDPGLEGNQDTKELDYPGYQRLFVESASWENLTEICNGIELRWPQGARDMQGEQTATFVGLGLKGSGPGYLARRMAFDDAMTIKANSIPAILKGKLKMTEA